MSSKKIRGGKAEVEATIKDRIDIGLKRIKGKLKSFAKGTAKIGGALIGSSLAVLTPMAMAVNQFSEYGDTIDKMSARTNVGAEELQTLGFAARRMGGDLGTVERAVKGLQKNLRGLEQGLSTQKKAFGELNLSIDDFEGKSPDERLKLIAERMQNIDPNRRAALAMDVLGKAGQQLLPLLNQSADGIEALQQRAKDLGIPISSEDSAKAAELNDRLGELKEIVQAAWIQIGSALAPTVIDLVTALINGSKVVLQFVKRNKMLILGVGAAAVAIGALGAVLMGVSFIAIGLVAGLTIAAKVLAVLLSPIGLVIGAVVALAAAFIYFSGASGPAIDFVKSKLGELLAWGKKVFGGIQDAIMAGDWALAGKIMWTAIKIAFHAGIGWVMAQWRNFKVGFLNVGDLIVSTMMSKWTEFFVWIGKKLAFLIDKANAIAKKLTGSRLLAIDSSTFTTALTIANEQRQRELRDGLAERKRAREQQSEELAAQRKQRVDELSAELNKLIKEAGDKRAEVEKRRAELAAKKKPKLPEFSPAPVGKALKKSSFGSFNAQLLGRFRSDSSARETAEATKATAKNTEAIKELLENNDGLVVT